MIDFGGDPLRVALFPFKVPLLRHLPEDGVVHFRGRCWTWSRARLQKAGKGLAALIFKDEPPSFGFALEAFLPKKFWKSSRLFGDQFDVPVAVFSVKVHVL